MKKIFPLGALSLLVVVMLGGGQSEGKCIDCKVVMRAGFEVARCDLVEYNAFDECVMVDNYCDMGEFCTYEPPSSGDPCVRSPGEWCPPECFFCSDGPWWY